MKKRVLWSFLMILVLIFSGCGPKNRTVKYATLCGCVIDAADGMPIPGATVSIDGKVKARTNAEGWFETERFPIGARAVTFAAHGYSSEGYYVTFREEGRFQLVIEEGKEGSIFLFRKIEGATEPASIYDLDGLGKVTISANQKIDSLLFIPYNVSMTEGTYTATLTVETGSGIKAKSLLDSLRTEEQMVTSAVSGESEKEAFYQRLREQELEAIRAQLGRGVPFGLSQELLPEAEKIPETELNFYKIVSVNGKDTAVEVTATQMYSSEKSYIYLDNEFQGKIDQSIIPDLGMTFDDYYNQLVTAFAPVGMDVDGFPGIFYLLTPLDVNQGSYVAGYFYGINEYSKSNYWYSNEKEILFLTTHGYDDLNKWSEMVKSTMAHELQHLINFTNRVALLEKGGYNEYEVDEYATETWINEGLSMVAEDLVYPDGHNPALDTDRVIPYLTAPAGDSLCTWKSKLADYAPAYMFMRYFVDRFGEPIIKELLQSNQFGLDSLVSVSNKEPFVSLFRNWLTAVYVGCQDTSQKSGFEVYDKYSTLKLFEISQGNPLAITKTLPASLSIPDTTGAFILLENLHSEQEITVSISGFGSSQFKLRLLMFPSEGNSFNLQPKLIKLR